MRGRIFAAGTLFGLALAVLLLAPQWCAMAIGISLVATSALAAARGGWQGAILAFAIWYFGTALVIVALAIRNLAA